MLREIAYAMQSASEGLAGNLIDENTLETTLSRYLKEELGLTQPKAAVRDLIEQLRVVLFAITRTWRAILLSVLWSFL
ncbi:MAG TPA: hypothetical protein PLD20_14230 [Blastocatellia bacterium]|nr:hypothetical protein [Blastocatellia bacterium]HMZ19090.1 hypothetical protein [Blastocatellia bacterium]HNG30282.1 hypothetical protein [Blastocatellia bacterium]